MKSYVALLICLLSISIAAQQPAPPKAPAPPAAPQASAPPAPPARPAPAGDEGKLINIRLDVSVIDQVGAGIPQPKTLMVMLLDFAMGRTRAAFEDRWISVDARPMLIDGRIRVDVTIQSEAPQKDPTLSWRNGFSLILENGKPMIALETSDAATKRKMSIEVKATVQK